MDARGDCIRTSAPCRTHNPTAQTDRPPISSSFFRNLRSPMGSSAILTTSCNRGNKKKIQKTKHALSRIPTINSRHPRKKKNIGKPCSRETLWTSTVPDLPTRVMFSFRTRRAGVGPNAILHHERWLLLLTRNTTPDREPH